MHSGIAPPDEKAIRHFRNGMTETGTFKRVMKAFDWRLHKKGYIPLSKQIIDASLVPAPKQRNTDDERQAIKDGNRRRRSGPMTRPRQHKRTQVRYKDGKPLPMIALPVFGYKSHISIDRLYGFIRAGEVTSAAHADGRMLRHVIAENSSSEVWADTAYRSRTNETWLADRMLISRIHLRKPKGQSMPTATARANAAKSAIRARIEHVFAHQRNRSGLFIRTIDIKRADAKLTLANLAYNFDRLIFTNDAQRQHESALNPVNGREMSYAMIKKDARRSAP